MADGRLQDPAKLAVRHGDLAVGKEFSDVLAVKKQVIRFQNRHQSRILKRHQITGRYAAGKERKALIRL